MRYAHLAQRLFNRPLAITPDKAEIVMAALADRFGITHLFREGRALGLKPMAFDGDDMFMAVDGGHDCGYDVIQGVAVIEIDGTLVQKNGTLRPYSGMTGYDGIRQNFVQAFADDNVAAIVLSIDSPGGEVAGCFDLCDMIQAARGPKPIWAILNENACSGAYAIASAADRITVPRTGFAGSIGVIIMHADLSKALDKQGIAVTLITYGAQKSDGNPYEPLPAEVKDRFQAETDAMGDLFVATVARNRTLSADQVRNTEAGIFMGAAAVAAGLADAVAAPDEAFRQLLAQLG